MSLNQTVFILLALLAVNIATAEKLSCRPKEDNQWRLFIENSRSEASDYSVDVIDLNKKQPVTTINTFQPSLMKGILEANLSIDSLPEGVYSMDLKREDVSLNPNQIQSNRLTWDNEYLTQTVDVDRRTSELSWEPSVPCIGRIVAVLPSGLLLDVVTEWTFYAAEGYTLEYDFIGDDGRSLRSQANLSIFAQCIPLPTDFLIQGQPEFAEYASHPFFKSLQLPCTPLSFDLSTNADRLDGDPGLYVGLDATSITVRLEPETANQLSGKRFEVLIYLDGEFIHEEAQGTSPYTYRLPGLTDTDQAQAISVNVLDYLGNWGTQTLHFQFKP